MELSHVCIGSTQSFPRADLRPAGELSFPVVVQERAQFVAYDSFEGFRPVSGVDFDKSPLPLEVDVFVQHVMLLFVVLTTPSVFRVDTARLPAPEHYCVVVEPSDQFPISLTMQDNDDDDDDDDNNNNNNNNNNVSWEYKLHAVTKCSSQGQRSRSNIAEM